jgi:hypothetical protein
VGVFQVDRGLLQRGGGRFDISLGLLIGGNRVVVVLAADAFDRHQLLVARHFRAAGHQVGLGLGQRSLGRVVGCLVGGGIDLVQRDAGLDVGAFDKQAFLNQATDLRAHFGHLISGGAARQFGGDLQRLRRHFKNAHFRHLRLRCSGRGFGATSHQGGCSDQGCGPGRPQGRLAEKGFHILKLSE